MFPVPPTPSPAPVQATRLVTYVPECQRAHLQAEEAHVHRDLSWLLLLTLLLLGKMAGGGSDIKILKTSTPGTRPSVGGVRAETPARAGSRDPGGRSVLTAGYSWSQIAKTLLLWA